MKILSGFIASLRKSQFSQRYVSTLASRFNSVPPRPGFKLGFNRQKEGCLFGIPELEDASGFSDLKSKVELESEQLVAEATSSNRTRKLVQVFDDLSDTLCRVADMADFVRVAHPDKKYRQAADEACLAVSSIVQQMNTNVGLYTSLKGVVEQGDRLSSHPYDDTDRRVAQLFLNDFEQCGIHLDETKRKRFVELTEAVMVMEGAFQAGTFQPSVISKSDLPERLRDVFKQGKQVTVSGTASDHHDEAVREASYRAYLLPNEQQSKTLDYMLAARDQLSKLVGFKSFAERALQGTMTETPENVTKFLHLLSDQLQSMTSQDFAKMKHIKERSGGTSNTLNPWDVTYCTALNRQLSVSASVSEISNYLSLGSCMEGLKLLTEKLYGITLQDVTPDPGECWHSSVHKLQVERMDNKEVIGYIYCDFFERADKPGQDCHFTIQGGRQRDDGSYQEPKVVLMMNFPTPTASKPSLLSPQQLDNLFHEFGHAMHSMIGRTRYQHVTGTRCSTDFAEVPSILMEYFTSDYRVLREFACHYETGEPIPENIANQIISSKSLYLASDTQLQIFYSSLDQALHSSHPLGCPTIDILSQCQNNYYGLPHVPNTAWHLRFGHLVGYGAKYFAYLMSRAIAASIWQNCFKDDPFCRLNGDKYMREILQHGGGRPPVEMVQSLIGQKPTIDSLVKSLIDETRSAGNYGS